MEKRGRRFQRPTLLYPCFSRREKCFHLWMYPQDNTGSGRFFLLLEHGKKAQPSAFLKRFLSGPHSSMSADSRGSSSASKKEKVLNPQQRGRGEEKGEGQQGRRQIDFLEVELTTTTDRSKQATQGSRGYFNAWI